MTPAEMDIIIGANVDQAIAALRKLGYTITQTEQKASGMAKKTGKDFTGLSRIIQDLPFGFIAISNNLTQLLPAAGALGLAFSALVSVVTFLSTGFSNWTRGLKDNKDALKESAEATKELDANAGKEIAHLTVLTNAAKDTNLSMKERLAAVQQLRQEFPSYFKDLQTEKILNGDVAAAVQATSNALFQRAVIRQKESQLGPIAGQLFDLRQQREELEKQEAALKRLSALAGQTRQRGGIISSLTGAGSQDKKAITDVAQQIAQLDKQIMPLQGQFKRLSQAIIDAGEAGGKGIFSDDVKEKVKNLKELPKDKFQWLVPDFSLTVFEKIDKGIKKLTDKPFPINYVLIPNVADPLADFKKNLDAVNATIESSIENLAAAVGEAIGTIFSGQGNPFDIILNVLGQGIKSIGKQLIEIGVIAQIAQKALATILTNPSLALAAGIALVALGTAIANIKQPKKFATGGVVTRPTLALVGEQGPERITPLGYEGRANNNWMSGEVVFNISGQNLRGILRRADQTAYNTF